MMVLRVLGFLACFGAVGHASAQILPLPNSLTKPKPPVTPPPPDVEVTFADGGKIRVVLLEESVKVQTRYGLLTIPLQELRSVKLGLRYPAGMEEKITNAIGRLNSLIYKEREAAQQELIAMKEYALAEVTRAMKHSDPEIARRAENIVNKINSSISEDRKELGDQDTIVTSEFTLKGKMLFEGLKVRSRQFGEVVLKVEDIRAIRRTSGVMSEKEITLEASQYGQQGWAQWYDTGIDIDKDIPVTITASGTIQLLQGNQISATPVGHGNQVQGPIGHVLNNQFANTARGQWNSGMLVGRVNTSAPFAIGTNLTLPEDQFKGRLFLIVSPNPWGSNPTGSFKVKIKHGD